MFTLAIINQKGGVGKTTTAVTLAHGLTLLNRRVLLVDLDAQGNVADALGLIKRPGLYKLLIDQAYDAAVTSSGRERLSLVLSDKRTVEAKQILAGRNFREYALSEALEIFEDEGFDVVILDAAPGVDVLQVGALVACSGFIIPVALDHLAVVGAGDALASAAALSGHGIGGEFLGVLPTMWERTTRESHTQLEELVTQFEKLVWPPIPLDVKAREAPAYGKTLYEYAPRSRVLQGIELEPGKFAGGYNAVVRRLMEVVNG